MFGGLHMKNKYASKITEQMLFDIRQLEGSMRNLSEDQVRMEFQFRALWDYVYEHQEELAKSPELQMVKCNDCKNWTKDYQIQIDEYSYVSGVICKLCLKERENNDEDT
jgi:hypothetical protein